MTPKEILEGEIADKLKKNPDKVKAVSSVVEFVVTGKDGGTWTIDCTKPGGQVKSGSTGSANLTVTVSDTDFVDVYTGKLNPQMGFFSGKIKLKGDMGLAMKLGNILK
jgi:putative sterol carrier protein